MKKIVILLNTIVLATLSFAMPDFISAHHPKMKKPLPNSSARQIKQQVQHQMPKEIAQPTRQKETLSWLAYLTNLHLALENNKGYSFEENVHPYLSKMDPKNAKDKNIAFALNDYKTISAYFQHYYGNPQQGTLQQYKALYEAFNDLSPLEHNILPTIAIWQTGSVEAVLPYPGQEKDYWDNPLLAAKAYDIMAKIDYPATQKMFKQYLPQEPGVNDAKNAKTVKTFFAAWRAQKDKTLPSVQDANMLEKIVLGEE